MAGHIGSCCCRKCQISIAISLALEKVSGLELKDMNLIPVNLVGMMDPPGHILFG